MEEDRVYVDHGLTGTNRVRPGLREALAACFDGDTLVVTKLYRLARSLPDARTLASELTTRAGSNLTSAASSTTPPTPLDGSRSTSLLRGKQPQLSPRQEAHLVSLYQAGEHTVGELEELFAITRSTVYRAVRRGTLGVSR